MLLLEKYARQRNDKTKIGPYGNNRKCDVRRGVNKAYCKKNTIAKHGGGSLTLWGCMSFKFMENLMKINGQMDAKYYQKILTHNFLSCAQTLCMGRS